MAEPVLPHSLSVLLNHASNGDNMRYSDPSRHAVSPARSITNTATDSSVEPTLVADLRPDPSSSDLDPVGTKMHDQEQEYEEGDHEPRPVICKWENCHLVLLEIPELVAHLAEEHVGKKQESYACEWKGCPRFGVPQATRFSLLSHMRCHTGEKPFVCPRCKKAFPRSDAMQKHVKSQHGELEPGQGAEPTSELSLTMAESEPSLDDQQQPPLSDTAKILEGLKAQGIPVFVQEIRLLPKRKMRTKKKKAIAANLVPHKSLLFESSPLSAADKDKLAHYYVEYIEHKDLSHEYQLLLRKMNRLKKQVNLLKNEIWP